MSRPVRARKMKRIAHRMVCSEQTDARIPFEEPAMTLNLQLAPEVEAKLRQRAGAAGKDVGEFVEDVGCGE